MPRTPATATRMAARAFTLRCPNCGGRPVLTNWFTLADACPRCAMRLNHGPHDHFVGTTMVNFLTAELLWAIGFAAYVVLSWPDVHWDALTYVSAAFMAALPVATYPFTRMFWLAVDLYFRPGDEGDRDRMGPPA